MRWAPYLITIAILAMALLPGSFDTDVLGEETRREVNEIAGPNVTVFFDQDIFEETFDPYGDPVEHFRITGRIVCEFPPLAPPDLECEVSLLALTVLWSVEQIPHMVFTPNTYERRFLYEVTPGSDQMNIHSYHSFILDGRWEYNMGRGYGDIFPDMCLMFITPYGRVELDVPKPYQTSDLEVGEYHTIEIKVTNLGNSYGVISMDIVSCPEWLIIEPMNMVQNLSAGITEKWVLNARQEVGGSREGEVKVRIRSNIPGAGNVTEATFHVSTIDTSTGEGIFSPFWITAILSSAVILGVIVTIIWVRKRRD